MHGSVLEKALSDIKEASNHFSPNKLESNNTDGNMSLFLFDKPGWSYHAKGLWLRNDSKTPLSVTYIGSSNMGERSWTRDFELGFLVINRNTSLEKVLCSEWRALVANSRVQNHVSFDREPFWRRKLASVFGRVFRTFL